MHICVRVCVCVSSTCVFHAYVSAYMLTYMILCMCIEARG